ncbi:hypothetical protein BaRGS_00017910, partial [Batillaria attramentaria]
TFPVPGSRGGPREGVSATPNEGATKPASRSHLSTPREGASRPTTQQMPREPTITEESADDARRHLYSVAAGGPSAQSSVNSSRSTLRSRRDPRSRASAVRSNFPLDSLASLSAEERSKRAMECSFCRSHIKEPKVFCCTRLCKKCLQSHIDICAIDNQVTCLVCRSNVTIPDHSQPKDLWADQFRTDVFLQRLQLTAEEIKQKHECYVCASSKGKKTAATVFCFDCDTYYCDSCNVMHLQLRGLTSHSTGDLATLQPRDIMSRRRLFCDFHKDRPLEKWCRQCGQALCQLCVEEHNKKCSVQAMSQLAAEKRGLLEGLKEEFDSAIKRAEEEDEMLRDRGSRVQMRVSQRKEDIEAAFSRIEAAVAARKKQLLDELADDSLQDERGKESKLGQIQALTGALKDNGALAEEMLSCGSDRDLIQSADDLVRQCMTLSEVSHNASRFTYDRPMSMARVDTFSVNTFITLLAALGEDTSDSMVAFKTKQMSLRTPEDKENPGIKDVLLMENNVILAVDNNNKVIKAIAPRDVSGFRYLRLDLKTRPWGITKLQPNVAAVSGHQCLYILTVSADALSLQTTVRTRKDYWSIAALSPINIAGAVTFPPSIDIVDITGRRLRTIDGESNGVTILKQPNFLACVNGNILVTDRQDKSLICMDQAGEVKFTFRGSTKDGLIGPQGVCTDQSGRAYLIDSGNVFLVSPEGKAMCKLLTGLPDPRAITVGPNNQMAVSMDGRGVTFFSLTELKGPY